MQFAREYRSFVINLCHNKWDGFRQLVGLRFCSHADDDDGQVRFGLIRFLREVIRCFILFRDSAGHFHCLVLVHQTIAAELDSLWFMDQKKVLNLDLWDTNGALNHVRLPPSSSLLPRSDDHVPLNTKQADNLRNVVSPARGCVSLITLMSKLGHSACQPRRRCLECKLDHQQLQRLITDW